MGAFSFSHRGSREAIRRLQGILRAGEDVTRKVRDTVDRRHAEVMGRRKFPEKTGRMRRGFQNTGSADRKVTATKDTLKITVDVPYASYQAHRVKPGLGLNGAEQAYVFAEPVREVFAMAVAGRV